MITEQEIRKIRNLDIAERERDLCNSFIRISDQGIRNSSKNRARCTLLVALTVRKMELALGML